MEPAKGNLKGPSGLGSARWGWVKRLAMLEDLALQADSNLQPFGYQLEMCSFSIVR
jgi:hypothetical protein